ncbi:hydroxyacylglutathione hydrolase [Propionivibrio sp.]|uniref:hydroxyacylglutathione hydrolase n=1 Tax=Propionivibrio sp. TaxID=2212460 RepID=UPI0026199A2C|nr:hydroxyacylglutathione hydrolase [Propionivibrio sp.]
MFDVIRIPAFKDNYIWLLRKGAAAVVVDPGDARPVLEVLEREGLTLVSILVTHHHADHQGGVADLLAHFPAEVFGPATESITALTQPLRGGETICLSSLGADFQVIAVPGHTLGHLAYYGCGCLFCGDTLFGGGCGRLFEGTPAQMLDSLTRLAALPEQTAVYCAHEYTEANLRFALAVDSGNRSLRERVDEVVVARAKGWATVPFTLALEKATNPFLRCREAALVATAQARVAQAHDALEVFTVLREWKNVF